MKPSVAILGVVLVLLGLFGYQYVSAEIEKNRVAAERLEAAKSLCNQWADKLDQQTTDAGVYVRWDDETLPENDPWGRPLRVAYSQGGVAEMVQVRSLGPDGESHTADDVVATRSAMNFKGIGTGIKAGAEETTRNAAKGAVAGFVDGIKDAAGRGNPAEGKGKN
jgi:hypothetical protein